MIHASNWFGAGQRVWFWSFDKPFLRISTGFTMVGTWVGSFFQAILAILGCSKSNYIIIFPYLVIFQQYLTLSMGYDSPKQLWGMPYGL